MRILHVVTRSQHRGAETAALELAHELDELGHHNRVIGLAPGFDGRIEPEIPTLGGRAGYGIRGFAPALTRLRRLVRSERPDVILGHGGQPTQVAALASAGARSLLIWQRILEFPPEFWSSMQRRWWQRVVRRVDGVVALTPELVDEVRRLGFGGPVRVISNSRRPERFLAVDRTAAASKLRTEVGIADDVALVGLVGHLIEQKRPERAIAVLVGLLEAGARAHLVIAGSGPLSDSIAEEVVRRGLGDHVSMLGFRRDVEWVLAGLDVLLLPSEAEAVPGIAIEAQMSGCPVVTFPLGGVEFVVEDGRTGIVLERTDTDEMVTATLRLLRDPDLRERLAERARARTADFSTTKTARMYEEFFTVLAAARRQGPRTRQ